VINQPVEPNVSVEDAFKSHVIDQSLYATLCLIVLAAQYSFSPDCMQLTEHW